jgi:hypothetical protein
VQPGGRIESVEVGGVLTSAGAGVSTVDIQGEVGTMRVSGGIEAHGDGADALRVDGGRLDLFETKISSRAGIAIRINP